MLHSALHTLYALYAYERCAQPYVCALAVLFPLNTYWTYWITPLFLLCSYECALHFSVCDNKTHWTLIEILLPLFLQSLNSFTRSILLYKARIMPLCKLCVRARGNQHRHCHAAAATPTPFHWRFPKIHHENVACSNVLHSAMENSKNFHVRSKQLMWTACLIGSILTKNLSDSSLLYYTWRWYWWLFCSPV